MNLKSTKKKGQNLNYIVKIIVNIQTTKNRNIIIDLKIKNCDYIYIYIYISAVEIMIRNFEGKSA